MAVGDATLFQIRDERCKRAFPIKRSGAFGTSPSLIRSLDHEGAFRHWLRKTKGDWQSGDLFVLCTDALAAWFLERLENAEKPWEIWRDFGSDECQTFESWVTSERAFGRLKNDDVTLVRVNCF
jgi:hypothetical protein